jgi:hypothetical protein
MPGFKGKERTREASAVSGAQVQIISNFDMDPTMDMDAPANRLTVAEFAEWKRKKVNYQ